MAVKPEENLPRTVTIKMTKYTWPNLNVDTAKPYMRLIQIEDDWLCFKDPQYLPESVSGRENRFNTDGQGCYYAASGLECAKAEVPNFDERDLYRIKSHTINVFDLPRYAKDNECDDQFLKAKDEGGYEICQSIAQHLNSSVAVTGILYSSYQSNLQGKSGLCVALLPESGCLVDGTYFIKG